MNDEQIVAELAATFGHEPSEVHTSKGATGRMCCGQCFVDWPCAVIRKIERVMLPVVRRAQAAALREAADWLERDAEIGGAPQTTSKGTRLRSQHTIALLGTTWAIESIEDRADALETGR